MRRAAHPRRVGGFLLVRALLVPALLVALFTALLAGCGGEVDITPPKASEDTGGEHAQQAQEALDDLVEAVRTGTRADAVALAVPDSRQLLGWVHDNADALPIGDLTMRYVDEGPELDPQERSELAPGAWRASVQLEYSYKGLDESPARVATSVVFVPDSDQVRIASFRGAGERTPLWLADRLSVLRTGKSLVVVAGASTGRYPGLATRALLQV